MMHGQKNINLFLCVYLWNRFICVIFYAFEGKIAGICSRY